MQARQIEFNGAGKMQYVTRNLPPIGDSQVLVKIEACGLCTWERYIYKGTESMPFPFVGGHEIAATVVKTGAFVGDEIKVGAPVAVAKWLRCNQCLPCRQGYDNHCEKNSGPSGKEYSGPGGFADYLICESYEVFPFAKDVPVHYAALAEPLACVIRAVNRMNVVPGDTATVVGAGLMGLLFLKVLKLKGCKVIVVQRSEKRRQNAKDMGAHFVLAPNSGAWVQDVIKATDGKGCSAIAYTAGGGQVLNQCLEAVRIGGVVMLYAPTHEEAPNIKADLIHFKEIVVTGALRHDKESFRQAVRLLGSGLANFDDLSLSFGSFENLEAEMKRADENRDIHRILLRW